MISHFAFNLHFCGDKWHWAPFCILSGHSYIFFGEKGDSDPLPILKMDLCSLYILDISSIWTYFFSSFCRLFFFILIMLSFAVQNFFFNLMLSHMVIFAFAPLRLVSMQKKKKKKKKISVKIDVKELTYCVLIVL